MSRGSTSTDLYRCSHFWQMWYRSFPSGECSYVPVVLGLSAWHLGQRTGTKITVG